MVGIPGGDEWIISFHTAVRESGYHWRESEDKTSWEIVENLDLREFYRPVLPVHHEGLAEGSAVLTQFRNRGRELRDDMEVWSDTEVMKEKILAFTNRFGQLHEGETSGLEEWIEEAIDFADMCDVRDAIRSAQFSEFKKRVRINNRGMAYHRSTGRPWLFAPKAIEWDERSRTGRTQFNFFDRAVKGGAFVQAWALVTYVVNKKVECGLSLRLHPLKQRNPTIEPAGVIATAYVRLWLGLVHRDDASVSINQTCKTCGMPIQGTRRKQFCNGTCRQAFHRKRLIA